MALTFERGAELHARLDDKIDELQKRQKEELRPLAEARAKLRVELLKMLNKSGQDSAKTENGTISRVVRTSASIEDRELFLDWLIEGQQWDAVDLKANSTFAKESAQETGLLPPGVKLNQSTDVSLTRAGVVRKPRSLVRPTKSNPFPDEQQEAVTHG